MYKEKQQIQATKDQRLRILKFCVCYIIKNVELSHFKIRHL